MKVRKSFLWIISGFLIASCGSTGLRISERQHLITIKANGRIVYSLTLYNDSNTDLKLISYSKP